MLAHLNAPLPDLAPFVTGYFPSELDRVLRQCLEKSCEDRPRGARELADALRAIVLPPEEVWTAERAREWWSQHLPKNKA